MYGCMDNDEGWDDVRGGSGALGIGPWVIMGLR